MSDLDLKRKQALAMQAQAAARAKMASVSTPDGRSTAPGTTREQAANIPEGMVFDPQTGGYVDTALRAERMGKAQGASANFIAGAPFVGEWADEAMGKADQLVSGRNPEIATETMRQSRDQFAASNPKTALAAEIAGGIVGSAPLAVAGAGTAMGATTTGGQIARGVGLGLTGGLAEGASAGAGRNDQNRTSGAIVGGAVGGGLGAVLGGLAPAIGKGAKALAQRVKRLDVKTIAEEFGISPAAARSVKSALANDDLGAAAQRIGSLGDDGMLADAGPSTQALLDASSKTGGAALRTTREAVESRAEAMGKRLPGKLDSILGTPKGIKTTARAIASETSPARKAAYDRAYASAIDYSGKGRNIEAVLQRVPPRVLQEAISEANEEMISRGARNRQIMAEIADDGSVVFREMPNVEQLDEIKQALDGIGRKAVDQFNRPTKQGLRYQRLARELKGAVSEAVPTYRQALKLGGDKLQRDQALDLGRRLLTGNTALEDVRDFIADGLSDEARTALRQGLREGIETNLSRVRRTITDPNVDAREAMQLVKEISSRDNLAKIRLVLGNARADQLLSELDKQAAALTLRGAVARNSDTAIRTAIQNQVRDEAQPGLIRRTLGKGGNPFDAVQEITETVMGIDPSSMSDRETAIFAEIADALTRIRGSEAERALKVVERAIAGQPIKDAEARLIGRTVAGGAGALGYQAGTQILEGR